ncbi:MAG: RNA polymerase sigma factor [Bacteroidota bacterium]
MTEKHQSDILNNWIGQYKGLLFKITRSYAFTPMDRDDLFQEITVQIWRSIPSFRGECAVMTWLYRIALNTAIRFSQREKKQSQNKIDIDHANYVLIETDNTSDDKLSWLYHEISKLHEIDRSICLLLLEGFSYKEMAEIVGITESNIGVRINRVKKYLTDKSKNYDF